MVKPLFRKTLGMPNLLQIVRQEFDGIPDNKQRCTIPLTDHLMSGIALFNLKYASLLQFDQSRSCKQTQANLKTLYGVNRAPCDTYLRTRLDSVTPDNLRSVFTRLFALLQRGKVLEPFLYCIDTKDDSSDTPKLKKFYLLSIDGTQFFTSSKVHCDNCCEKHHKNGNTEYYHQMLSAAIVHPDQSVVFPLAPESIQKQDGEIKNDCERNASKRLLTTTRKEHPHTKFIVIEDGLASNGPHIQHLKSLNYNFILGAKPKDHTLLFETIKTSEETKTYTWTDENKIKHSFRYLNNTSLNEKNKDLKVNFLEYWETHPSGEIQRFSWVTNLPLNKDTIMEIMRAGRARWKIENETFNTLKNQGYHFEHNFGHGDEHLSNVMTNLMFLSFFIDQTQLACSAPFQEALKKAKSKVRLWQLLRAVWCYFLLPDWETYYQAIYDGVEPIIIPIDTS